MSQIGSRRKCLHMDINNECKLNFLVSLLIAEEAYVLYHSTIETNLGFVSKNQSYGKTIPESSCLYNMNFAFFLHWIWLKVSVKELCSYGVSHYIHSRTGSFSVGSSYETDSVGTQTSLSWVIPSIVSLNVFEIVYCYVVRFFFFFPHLSLFACCLVLTADYGKIDRFH